MSAAAAPRRATASPDAPLSFERVTVGYGARGIVRDATFEVRPGEFVGLVGPNGAGKSTLLRAVTGGADVLAGDILLGASLVTMPERERARIVGVVPQSQPTVFAFGVRAFVEMGRHPHMGRLASPGPRDAAAVDEALERTDTARLVGERVDELSGGDLQRLTLAQALAQEPRVLLLDEPTSHLDLNHTLQVLELVRSLADGGMAVLGVFHDLELAARYADRIGIVADGRLTPPAPPREALSARVVSDVFGVRAVVHTDPVTGGVAITPVLRADDLAAAPACGRVGLVCGSGTGAALMRRLALAGFAVHAGALNRGDVDFAVAEALGAETVALPPFGEMDAEAEAAVAEGYAGSACVVVCPTPFGSANLGNLRAAIASGRPLVPMGSMDAGRDFAHGGAAEAWAEAIAAGAHEVQTEDEAFALVQSMTGTED